MMNPWNTPTDDGLTPAQRITHDVLVNEQQLRALAEKHSREMRQLLRDLAARFNAQALDDRLRADPRAVEKFTLADWRAFFADLSPVMDIGWGQTITLAEYQAVQTQLTAAQQTIQQLQQEVKQLGEAQIQEPTASLTHTVTDTTGVSRPNSAMAWPPLPDTLPADWNLSGNAALRPLVLLQLWLIATQGRPLFLEGRHWLAVRNPADENRANKVAGELADNGLVLYARFPNVLPRDEAGQTTSVSAAELTDRGKSLCHELEWPTCASELETLRHAPLSERQIAGGLLLAAYARMRGHTVQVQADGLVLLDNTLTLLVMDDEPPTDLSVWQRVFEQQGRLALCAATPSRRALHIAAAQAQGWPGQATDVQTLNTHEKAPLWAEKWPT